MVSANKIDNCTHSLGPELENVDDLTVRVFNTLHRVLHLNRQVMLKTISQRGVQATEAFALTLVAKNDGVTQSELAGILHLSHPRVSSILRSLEESGSIERHSDDADRRLTRVFATAEGRRREKGEREVLGEYVNRTIGALSESDRVELVRLLGELADKIVGVLDDEEPRGPQAEEARPR